MRELRGKRTQADVAAAMGISRVFLQQMETNKRGWSVEHAAQAAAALGVHPSALFWPAPPTAPVLAPDEIQIIAALRAGDFKALAVAVAMAAAGR